MVVNLVYYELPENRNTRKPCCRKEISRCIYST